MTVSDTPSSGILRVTLDLPDFWIGPDDDAEDVEVAMNLASDQVGAIFIAHDGDDPATVPHTLVGTLVKIEVVRPFGEAPAGHPVDCTCGQYKECSK